MPKPEPKSALSKAPTSVHPVAPRSPAPAPSEAPHDAGRDQAEDVLEMHSVRIPASLRQRMKLHAAVSRMSLQEITEAAITEWLDRQG